MLHHNAVNSGARKPSGHDRLEAAGGADSTDSHTDPKSSARTKGDGLVSSRVLVVDDNIDALEMMAEALELLGYETHTAVDAETALEVACKVKPCIALLDIGLPFVDGYELGRRLLSSPELAGIKLIALTGHGNPSDRARSESSGFLAHLVKPVDLAALDNLLKSISC